MTRRKKPEGAVRNHLVTVRLDDTEYSAVCDSAKDAGLSLSDYFRHQGVYGKVEIHNQIVADFPKLEKLTQEFSAIGNNLNQIARRLNTYDESYPELSEEVKDAISDLTDLKFKVLKTTGDSLGNVQTYRL